MRKQIPQKWPAKKWRNLLDKMWREFIKERANHKCEWCGANPSKLDSAHIYSRNNKSVRWDIDNGLALCTACHFKAHQRPIEFVEFIKKRLGEKKYNELRLRAKRTKKFKEIDYISTAEFLESEIAKFMSMQYEKI